MKKEICWTLRPMLSAYTGPMLNRIADDMPAAAEPSTPSGESRYSSRRLIGVGRRKPGALPADSNSGTSAIEISTETRMNSWKPRGCATFSNNWPAAMLP